MQKAQLAVVACEAAVLLAGVTIGDHDPVNQRLDARAVAACSAGPFGV